jgi:hypothetical protein
MVGTSDMLAVLGTIFVAIIIISLFGSVDQKTHHTTVIRPTRTIVRPTRTVVRPTRTTIVRPPRHHPRHHRGRYY